MNFLTWAMLVGVTLIVTLGAIGLCMVASAILLKRDAYRQHRKDAQW